jgi:hypothetical protein
MLIYFNVPGFSNIMQNPGLLIFKKKAAFLEIWVPV